ncbi:MAG: hypothetical protein IPM36_20910 [Lewinellaceae bacterium]|nr:hypothetical protein [Lewinellaceae bacterium]
MPLFQHLFDFHLQTGIARKDTIFPSALYRISFGLVFEIPCGLGILRRDTGLEILAKTAPASNWHRIAWQAVFKNQEVLTGIPA